VGDGPLRPELEREAGELGLSGRVKFLGERQDIAAILASADVSVLPSTSESLSNVILESMAARVPVIASRVGGNPELVTSDRGILVTPGDEQALVAAIERLLRDSSLRAEFGRSARKFAESDFTIAAVRQRYEELYTELLARKESRKSGPSIGLEDSSRTKRLRVAIVAPSLRYVGGQSAQADSLLANWKNDPAVKADLIPIDPLFPPGLKWAESIPLLRTILREPIYLFSLWRGLREPDIVHVFSASYWSFLLAPSPAWMMARALGKRTLIHYHSGEARDHLRRSRAARHVLARVDRLVVPSGYLADVFREFGLAAQVVPNTVDWSQFRFRIRKPLRPYLVCTRGFHSYYRADLVVGAFAEVQREFPDARLDLIGQGPLEQEIRGLARDLKLTGVNFAGVASRQKIGEFYDAADIFINASSLDNMPVSILEAFACGTPVVSTAPDGIRHLVEHERTGLLSEPGDARALAENVIRLVRDPDLCSQIVLNAYEESRRYCWTEVRGQWIEIYESLAKQTLRSAESRSSVA
jgi:glycosyltransferase involved in cell wall biosynthesis